ncbi:DUF3726 domain-containing protein [Sulfitobacter sp. SK012]|uniref:DUF3726 domain-containing protein n=1 Tax=Sulfitobacter sp. SK012 TaxID=1389005 RepID=UPI000E0AF88F|nr:DUF3726 domain-containing protein [Sulfitobacter sp. SK012]AXI45554.1 DUF3726 domain-containing protein [Sulfitobacter sp. SK012]
MSHSLNEIAAHAKRAARGTGLSWGMAEEAARATRWLASQDLAGPALLSDVLAKNDGLPHAQVAPVSLNGEWRAPEGDLCPLAVGTTLSDCADQLEPGRPVKMANVSYPLLVLPFAAWAAIHLKQPVRVTYQNVQIDTDGDGIWIDDPHREINTSKAKALTCQIATKRTDGAKLPGLRGTVTPEIWARLDAFAQRTFAPATDASRLLGAGAGVSDND